MLSLTIHLNLRLDIFPTFRVLITRFSIRRLVVVRIQFPAIRCITWWIGQFILELLFPVIFSCPLFLPLSFSSSFLSLFLLILACYSLRLLLTPLIIYLPPNSVTSILQYLQPYKLSPVGITVQTCRRKPAH